MNDEGRIIKVSGPLVIADKMASAKMFDVVRVGEKNLVGEIVELRGDVASIQVYEDTSGLGPDEKVISMNEPLSVELGPGLIATIYDGIQRPLNVIASESGDYIPRGFNLPSIDRTKKWFFQATVKEGDAVSAGDVIGTVQETDVVLHKIMVPFGISGKVVKIGSGEFCVSDVVATISDKGGDHDVTLMQKWPVRKPRPYKEKLIPEMPMITGQRVIDSLFPIGMGGTACVPGPFGSGKTIVQHQLAKWADADIIVYIGCGERGNEMVSVLMDFPRLIDPKTGGPLINRTVLIANTSNMPVAAREASIYTGITIAEYYRDMGYSVATMADSTSRWAEALREMSGRLEEMPGEEGYPAYLPARLADFYERAGRVVCLGSEKRSGALSVIGAVSPPGGDLSDPVVQATLKVVKVFWSLEDWLAYERHFPAINWLTSYSLYHDNLASFFPKDFGELRQKVMDILQQESDLKEITRLVGIDAISPTDRLILETAKMIREDFLHQNAFDDVDTYSSFAKQHKMLRTIMNFHELGLDALEAGADLLDIMALPVREKIAKMKYIPEDKLSEFAALDSQMAEAMRRITKKE